MASVADLLTAVDSLAAEVAQLPTVDTVPAGSVVVAQSDLDSVAAALAAVAAKVSALFPAAAPAPADQPAQPA